MKSGSDLTDGGSPPRVKSVVEDGSRVVDDAGMFLTSSPLCPVGRRHCTPVGSKGVLILVERKTPFSYVSVVS